MWLILVPALFCCLAVFYDLRQREIPDSVSWGILATGLISASFELHPVTCGHALLGVSIGFLAVLPFTLTDGIGAGDLKLIAALGSWLGIFGTLALLFWTAIAGMVLAIATALLHRKDYPYAPAILAGLLVAAFVPESMNWLINWIRG